MANCSGRLDQQVPSFNLQNINYPNRRNSQFERTWQFGGDEYNISSMNSSIQTPDECLSIAAQSEKKSKLNWITGPDVNNLYNWTFFPKGKPIILVINYQKYYD